MSASRTQLLIWGSLTAIAPLSIDMYLPAFPTIATHFGVHSGDMAYSLTAYFLGMALGQLLHGPLSDRFGRVRILRDGVAAYLVASLLCALSPNFTLFLLGRFAQAFAGCAALVVVRAMVRDQCDSATSAKVFSRLILVMGLAPMLAPSLGAGVATFFEWQAIFIVLALYAAIMLWCIQRYFILDIPSVQQLDWRAMMTIYARLLRDANLMRYLLCNAFLSAGMFAYIAGSAYVFIEHYHLSETQYAWLFGVNALALIAMAQCNAILLRHFTARQLLLAWQIIALVMALTLLCTALLNGPLWLYAMPIWLYLGVMGITQPNASALAMASQKTHIGSTSALLGSVQFAFAMLASNAVGFFHDGSTRPLAAVLCTCTVLALFSFVMLRPSAR